MAGRNEFGGPFRPSVLDRLLVDNRNPSPEAEAQLQTAGAIVAQVRRDLRDLIETVNTLYGLRARIEEQYPNQYKEIFSSVLSYGLPDIRELSHQVETAKICSAIKKAIEEHEPRLTEIEVKEVKLSAQSVDTLHAAIQISAQLHLNPAPAKTPFTAPATWTSTVGLVEVQLQEPGKKER